MDPKERNRKEWENPSNWRGPFYFGEHDTRVMVPRRGRIGRGYTFNLANTAGRLIFTAIIAIALAAIVLALASGGKGA